MSHALLEGRTTVGRLTDNDIQIDHGSVSSHHAEIVVQDGGALLRDNGSTNGTFVNGEQVTEHNLQHGDEIYFGHVGAVFAASPAPATEEELAPPAEPEAPVATAATAGVPATFRYMSPLPKPQPPRDTLGLGAWAAAGVALAAAGYALFTILA